MRKLTQTLALLVLTLSLLLGGCAQPAPGPSGSQSGSTSTASETAASLDDIPAFSGEPYVVIDDNQPSFTASELTTSSFESYAPLDSLGRCGVAYACISTDLMPADGEKRGSISDVKPSGWITAKYDFVDGKYLYNRCHLIGWQLTAENANRSNLITGTRYMNVDGMLPFENMVADYIKETGSHVMYRVTPIFDGDDLVAQGVQMEAYSVEDDGDGICFNVFCYNVQPGRHHRLRRRHKPSERPGRSDGQQHRRCRYRIGALRTEHQLEEVPRPELLRRGQDVGEKPQGLHRNAGRA